MRIRRRLRRALMTPLDRWRQRRRPLLSVVVPVYNGEQYLDECLVSARRQDYRRVEIVVIDDGSTDGSRAIAERHARADRRVKVLSQANAGVGEARRAAVAASSGEFLTFLDADDSLTRDGLRAAMDVLDQTGSDVSVMPYQRLDEAVIRPAAPWIRALHASPARGVTLSERPDVLVNAVACAKVFRRSFWDSTQLAFPTVLLAGDQIVSAQAYRDADGIDISAVVGYNWRRQASSISQGQVTPAAVHARQDAIDAVLELLAGLPEVQAERALQYLRYNIPNSMLKLERAGDDYLDALIERVPPIVEAAPRGRFEREVPAEYRVLYALLAHGDRDTIWKYVRAEGMQAEMHRSGMEPDGFTAYLPGWGSDPVAATAYVLTAEQTALKVKVRSARRSGNDLVVDLAAWFPNVELSSPVLTAAVDDGAQVEISHEGEPAAFVSRLGSTRPYPGSGWLVTLRGVGRRRPRRISLTLEDGSHHGTAAATIPR